MAKNYKNDLDITSIYYALGNANTQRQENELAVIIKNAILQDGSWSQQVPKY